VIENLAEGQIYTDKKQTHIYSSQQPNACVFISFLFVQWEIALPTKQDPVFSINHSSPSLPQPPPPFHNPTQKKKN
jgi:hypothetical protein